MDFTILAFCHPYCLEGKCNMHLSEIWHSKKNDCRLSRTQVLWQIYKKNMKAHRQIVVFLLSPVQNLSLRRVFANVLGPAAPLAACAKWRLSVATCRFGIAGWHFLAAKGTNFGAIMYRLATVFRLASVRPPHRVYRVRR